MDTILAKKLFYIRFAQCKQSENLKLHLFHTSQSEKKMKTYTQLDFLPQRKEMNVWVTTKRNIFDQNQNRIYKTWVLKNDAQNLALDETKSNNKINRGGKY